MAPPEDGTVRPQTCFNIYSAQGNKLDIII